jgi:SAM-dependent methyltransferase
MLTKAYDYLIGAQSEQIVLATMVASVCDVESTILDVGCGFGRNIKLLNDHGYQNITGIEINAEIVAHNNNHNMLCLTPVEFDQQHNQYDLILMSHVIEHFSPADLVSFLDHYLCRLKSDGHLIIVTPLMSDSFYEDFDHIKPYSAASILSVFGGEDTQIQYYSENKLRLLKLWFRMKPLHFNSHRNNLGVARLFLQASNLCAALLFCLTKRFIGKADGWLGVFKKI